MAVKKAEAKAAATAGSKVKLELFAHSSYTYKGVKYLKGVLYELPEALAEELLELDAGNDMGVFRVPREKKGAKVAPKAEETTEVGGEGSEGEGTEGTEGAVTV